MRTNYRLPVVLGIIIIAVNIIAFAIPVERTATFVLCDVFVVIAIAAQLGFSYMAFGRDKSLRSKVYGWPIMRIGLMYLVATFAIALILILLPTVVEFFTFSVLMIFLLITAVICLIAVAFGAYSLKMGIIFAASVVLAGLMFYQVDTHNGHVPIWIGIVLFVIVTAAAGVGMIATASIRDSVEEKLDRQVADTTVMMMLRGRAEALYKQTDDPEMKKTLQKVWDSLKYSSPVSTSETAGYEDVIGNILTDMSIAVQNHDADRLNRLAGEMQIQVEERKQAAIFSAAKKQ